MELKQKKQPSRSATVRLAVITSISPSKTSACRGCRKNFLRSRRRSSSLQVRFASATRPDGTLTDGICAEFTNPANKKADAMDVVEECGSTKAEETTTAAPAVTTGKKKTAKNKISRHRHARNAVVFPSLRKNLLRQRAKRMSKA